ncbi:hypothetical protein [Sphingobacterium sp. LRF_L2]|uniref:hypothetical protein n=1 Tax=Sphingobacterium sp. LRF_L2 TaxID=3369421 RepID=UPI003F62C204
MIWEVDGQKIKIIVKATEGIEIHRWDSDHKEILVSGNISKDELKWSIKNLLATGALVQGDFTVEPIGVFGRKWPVRRLLHPQQPFFYENIIHCYVKGDKISAKDQKEIEKQLLLQEISREVAKWEEYFRIMIPKISLRKNTKKPFSITSNKDGILFDSTLCHQSIPLLHFCVFNAIAEYISLSKDRYHEILEKKYPTHSSLTRIINYEYNESNYN